jgi:hypothetical protein
MSAPATQENSLRIHDEAVMRWLGGLTVDYGDAGGRLSSPQNGVPIIAVFATPDRAAAAVKDRLIMSGWITKSVANEMAAADDMSVLPLPVCSVTRADPVQEPMLAGVRKRRHAIDDVTLQTYWSRHPSFFNVDYTLTFWCAKVMTENHIREWMMAQQAQEGCAYHERTIPVVHAAPWGTLHQSFKCVSSGDLSELEGTEPRYKRFEFVWTLRMMVTFPWTEDA